MKNFAYCFRTTRCVTSSATTITISRKLTCRPPTPISRKIRRSTTRSTSCATRRPRRCSSAASALIVASVSCIYGLGSPEAYFDLMVYVEEGTTVNRDQMLRKLVDIQYQRNDFDFHRGTFRVRGDIVEVFPAYEDRSALRIEFFDENIESIHEIDPIRGKVLRRVDKATIYPASHYVTGQDRSQAGSAGHSPGVERASQGAAGPAQIVGSAALAAAHAVTTSN